MKPVRFLGRAAIGCLALVGLVVIVIIALGVAGALLMHKGTPQIADSTVLSLDLTEPLSDTPPGPDLARLLIAQPLTLHDVIDGLERAGDDPRVKGLVVHIGDAGLSLAEAQELRDAVATFRRQGKHTVAYSDSFGELGEGTRSYYLATAFDEIWIQPLGVLGLVGLRAEVPFFHGTLDKLGIKPHFDQREEFKTAMNILTQDAP
jgi:protease-4